MSLETDLFALLSAACPRTFPDYAPPGVALPYVTYQQTGGEAVNFLDRIVPNKRNASIQVSVWSSTRAEAMTLMQTIEDALRMTTVFQAEAETAPVGEFEPDVSEYAAHQNFNIWASR